jgi:hypothetical protein
MSIAELDDYSLLCIFAFLEPKELGRIALVKLGYSWRCKILQRWRCFSICRHHFDWLYSTGANPTIACYNASAGNFYNAAGSLERF